MRTLLHPTTESFRLGAILHALSDPIRGDIFGKIVVAGCVQACTTPSALGDLDVPKSSLSGHFEVLRESGLIRSERHGVKLRHISRAVEMEARCPGLLPAILNAYASRSPDVATTYRRLETKGAIAERVAP